MQLNQAEGRIKKLTNRYQEDKDDGIDEAALAGQVASIEAAKVAYDALDVKRIALEGQANVGSCVSKETAAMSRQDATTVIGIDRCGNEHSDIADSCHLVSILSRRRWCWSISVIRRRCSE